MNDSPKNKGLRKKLVLELMKKGIKDENVLKSINLIPRQLFLHKDFEILHMLTSHFQLVLNKRFLNHTLLLFRHRHLKSKQETKFLKLEVVLDIRHQSLSQ